MAKKNINEEFATEVNEIDPEHDKANWPTIHIDNVKELPNYEYVAAHGTYKDGSPLSREFQIMRGTDVQVPPSIVNVLKIAICTEYESKNDPMTGKNILVPVTRSSIPWRMVKQGNYPA